MFGVLALVLVYVSISYAVNHNTNCYINEKHYEYNGNISQTMSGITCLDWAKCNDNLFTRQFRDTHFPDGSINAASNYCRAPAIYGRPWCFTILKGTICSGADVCPVAKCIDNEDCYVEGQSKEYRGNIQETQGGIKCLNWKDHRETKHTRDVNFPEKSVDKAANFCRDPDASGTPWCHDSAGDHWDFCNVPVCSTGAN